MRKTFTLILSLFVLFSAKAQTVLTYSSHGMNAGDYLTLNEFEVVSTGEAGANQVWDFSTAAVGKQAVVSYEEDFNINGKRPQGISFACVENGERTPYFQQTPTCRLYYGVSGAHAQIKFDEPLVDMVYPFGFQSSFSGKMKGTYTTNSSVAAIDGEYKVEADAWGTLILPNGVRLNDVLRVKSTRNYQQKFSGTVFNIKVDRYLFYSSASRYAAAQIHDISQTCDRGCNYYQTIGYFDPAVTERNRSAQNSNAPAENNGIAGINYSVYPNPAVNNIHVDYKLSENCNVRISLVDLSGKELKVLLDNSQEKGNHTLSADVSEVSSSLFVLRLQIGSEVFTEKISKRE